MPVWVQYSCQLLIKYTSKKLFSGKLRSFLLAVAYCIHSLTVLLLLALASFHCWILLNFWELYQTEMNGILIFLLRNISQLIRRSPHIIYNASYITYNSCGGYLNTTCGVTI
jgi:hypothetical protein